jgi:predicted N-acetyltransferase YhbS
MTGNANIEEIQIRRIEPKDAARVAELAGHLGYSRAVDAVNAWIVSTLNSDNQTAFVACFEGDVVGWIEVSIQCRLQSAPFALIGGLVVREEIRGHGIGHRLCECAEQWSAERRVQTIRVTSRSSRADAHRFYVRGGYRETKTSVVFEKPAPKRDAKLATK